MIKATMEFVNCERAGIGHIFGTAAPRRRPPHRADGGVPMAQAGRGRHPAFHDGCHAQALTPVNTASGRLFLK